MKMRMTVVYEWNTGTDAETQNAYGTLVSEECADIDRDNVVTLGVEEFLFLSEPDAVSWSIEPV